MRKAGRSRPAARSVFGQLGAKDLLDPLGHVVPAAAPGPSGHEPPLATTQVFGDRLTSELGDRETSPSGFVSQLQVDLVRQLDGGPLHGMPAYHSALRRSRLRGRGFSRSRAGASSG